MLDFLRLRTDALAAAGVVPMDVEDISACLFRAAPPTGQGRSKLSEPRPLRLWLLQFAFLLHLMAADTPTRTASRRLPRCGSPARLNVRLSSSSEAQGR